MLAKRISSLQHPSVQHWADLVKKRSYREEVRSVLVSGEKLVRELARYVPLKTLITSFEEDALPAEERFLVTEGILKKITGLGTPDGYAAVVPLPPSQDLSSLRYLLILDQIADPGNLGTLLRTAYALGWEGIVATPGTVDFFNDKALRAAKGATFRLPLSCATPEEIISWGKTIYVADVEGKPLAQSAFQPPLALVLSNEARGPKHWVHGQKIHIPMSQDAESLNVASAGAILLYAMRCS